MKLVTARHSGVIAPPAAIALGRFDGVHIGHKQVLQAAAGYAKTHSLSLAVFTFTRSVNGPSQIATEEQKHLLLQQQGVKICYQPAFNSFCSLSPEEFFADMLLGEYNAKAIFCGENFFFGAQRKGDVQSLKAMCKHHNTYIEVMPLTSYNGMPASSSRIREALAAGQIEDVNAMLGREYEICFEVQHGKHLGTKLGFPTINQLFPPQLLSPAFGVYITAAEIDGQLWPSVTGYGTRPSVDNGAPSCETFIPGFKGELYGKALPVRFYKKIDNPHRFDSLQLLADAVQKWAMQSKAYFDAHPLNDV